MPVKSVESSPGHRVLTHTCEMCGAPASFGEGVDLRRALATGNVAHAGKWFCFEHWKAKGEGDDPMAS